MSPQVCVISVSPKFSFLYINAYDCSHIEDVHRRRRSTSTELTLVLFVLKLSSAVMSAAYIQVNFRLDFYMEANNMNPDQTAIWKQSDLGPFCLQYRLPMREQRQKS